MAPVVHTAVCVRVAKCSGASNNSNIYLEEKMWQRQAIRLLSVPIMQYEFTAIPGKRCIRITSFSSRETVATLFLMMPHSWISSSFGMLCSALPWLLLVSAFKRVDPGLITTVFHRKSSTPASCWCNQWWLLCLPLCTMHFKTCGTQLPQTFKK
jgi:hypothetical protein